MEWIKDNLQVGNQGEHAGKKDLKALEDLVEGGIDTSEQAAKRRDHLKAAGESGKRGRDILHRKCMRYSERGTSGHNVQ